MRKLVPLLLITWAAAAVLWAVLQGDDSDMPPPPTEPPAPKKLVSAPRLEVSGQGAHVPAVPVELSFPIHSKPDAERHARVWAWVAGGKRRLAGVLFSAAQGADRADPKAGLRAYWFLQRFLVGWRERLLLSKGEVIAAFAVAREDRHPLRMAGVLAALGVLGPEALDQVPALLALIGDPQSRSDVRALAAEVLLLIDPEHGATREGVGAALRAAGKGDDASAWLLDRIRERGKRAHALVPELLQAHDGMDSSWPHERAALRALAAVAPESDAVRLRLARELHPEDKWIAKVARKSLFSGSVEEVLALVGQLTGIARVIGIEILLKRGVDKKVLSPLLVPVLLDGSPVARSRAVTAMARVGTETGPYLAAIEELLAHKDDAARWVTGARALGALASVPGNKAVAIQRLFGLVRSPNVQVRVTAVQSILMHRTRVDAKLEMLGELLKDSEAKVRAEAVDGLGELVSEDKRAIAHLKLALSDSDSEIRALATYWLTDDDDAKEDDDR